MPSPPTVARHQVQLLMAINNIYKLSAENKEFITYLRALSIFIIVFGHVGGFWFFEPYCELLYVFVPIFFFLSGAVSYHSFNRFPTIRAYYCKRLIRLLVPYYLLCLLSIFIYVFIERQFPSFSFNHLLMWVQIRPLMTSMPFPIGQVWFLHTLFFITIASPIFFLLENKSSQYLIIYVIVLLGVSTVQFFSDIYQCVDFFGNNLFKPFIHSFFYILGVKIYSGGVFSKARTLWILGVVSLIISIAFSIMAAEPNLDAHTFSPDIYYVSISTFVISLFVLFQKYFILIVRKINMVHVIFSFFIVIPSQYFFCIHLPYLYLKIILEWWIRPIVFMFMAY